MPEDFLNWADELVVEVRHVEYLDRVPDEVWRLHAVDTNFERDEPVERLLRVVEDSDDVAGYSIGVQRNYTSWGASGSGHQVVLALSTMVGGVAAKAAWHALVELYRRARDDSPEPGRPVDRDEAIARADWHARAAFDLPAEREARDFPDGTFEWVAGHELSHEADSYDASENEWTITLADHDWTYTITMTAAGDATLLRISRARRR